MNGLETLALFSKREVFNDATHRGMYARHLFTDIRDVDDFLINDEHFNAHPGDWSADRSDFVHIRC